MKSMSQDEKSEMVEERGEMHDRVVTEIMAREANLARIHLTEDMTNSNLVTV